jgi:hypothetical protein
MDTYVSYLIRSVLISGLMLGYYLAVLRNRKLHSFNRVWLLTALLASLVLPLIRVDWLTWHSAARPPLAVLITGAHPAVAKTYPMLTVAVAAFGAVNHLKRRHRRHGYLCADAAPGV